MAPDSHNTAHEAIMGGLIRRGLRASDEMPGNCPDPGILAAYYDRSLDAGESAQFETHLSRCEPCREQIAALVRAEEKPSPAVRNTWLWDWRWLAPAAAALLIVSVWGVHRSILPARVPNGKQPLIAMSRPPQPPAPNALPPSQSPAESPASGEALVAPKSTGRTTPQLQTQQQAKTPEIDHTTQTLQTEKQATAANSQASARQNEAKVAQGSSDDSDSVADLKKAVGNPPATPLAGSPPAVPQPRAGGRPGGAPSESPINSLDTSASNQRNAFTSASADAASENGNVGGALGGRQAQPRLKAFSAGAVAQATEQRSGSTIIPTPDPKILWRIAGGNFVERTEDGGATWRGQVADPDAQLTAGSAPTNKTCWLVGKAGVIVVTKDSKQWKKLPPPVPADFVRVEAKNSSSAIVTAADGQKFSTGNGGKKWIPAK